METPKEDQEAPTQAPAVESDSPTSVKVKDPKADEEYSIDGGKTWVKPDDKGEVKFDKLKPATDYEVISRKAEDDTHNPSEPSSAAKVTTQKENQPAPGAPTILDAGMAGFTIEADQDKEYSIDGGKTWVKPEPGKASLDFKGLDRPAEYEVIARVSGTDTKNPSNPSTPTVVAVKDGQKAPGAPNAKAENPTTIVVQPAAANLEYSIDGGRTWVSAPAGSNSVTFNNLKPGETYEVIARKAEDDLHYASNPGQATKVEMPKADQDAPAAPQVELKDYTSIVVNPAASDEEYSIDGGKTWVKPAAGENSVVFDNLKPNTEYQVVSRKSETDANNASAPSAPAIISTTEEPAEIADEKVPLSEPETTEEPSTKGAPGWALANLVLAISTIAGAIWVLLKKHDDDEAEAQRKKMIRLAGIVPALAAAVTFLLTQNMTQPMQIVDKWTVLMGVYLALFGTSVALTQGKKDKAPEA